jgi:hypothetical protein
VSLVALPFWEIFFFPPSIPSVHPYNMSSYLATSETK